MKSYAASGHNILTAADIKHALDAGSGILGPVYTCMISVFHNSVISMGHIAHYTCMW